MKKTVNIASVFNVISCLREFLLYSQVYSQLIYLIKFIFTNRTCRFDVNGGTISKNEFNEVY